MVRIVAVEGCRGVGKTTLCTQLRDSLFDKSNGPLLLKFPSNVLLNILKTVKFDMTKLNDIVSYNMLFVKDFMEFKRVISLNDYYSRQTYIFDRYILSNLVYFKYDLDVAGFGNLWDGASSILLNMFNGSMVMKPDLIIYLHGESKQYETKFDDHLYKDKNLTPYFNDCLSDLKNVLNIPFEMVTSQRDDTFENVEYILKTRGLLN